jgi:hypothetical protein
LINAQLLAEGWNSPRATVCVHLAPTASRRIYQQRVGRVTRRHPGKEAGLVVDFVHPATRHDDPVVTLHSLLDRDVYRGGAIVVGPVRRGRGRRMRVERRVLPVCVEVQRRIEVLERELWRIAVENLETGEQHGWAALAGARVTASGWRRARAMLHFDRAGELRSSFLVSAIKRNTSPPLRLRALADIAAGRDPDTFDTAVETIGGWPREERREGAKILLRALVDRRIGRRDQANAWIWHLAEYTRELHEEYAVQRWPETKRLLGLLVNSSGGAHARNARRLVHAARKQDRRLAAALLAAALAHTPEAEEALRGARTRMARKPPALARELLRNFPKRRARNGKRKRRGAKAAGPGEAVARETVAVAAGGGAKAGTSVPEGTSPETTESSGKAAASAREAVESAAARVRAASTAEPAAAAPTDSGEQNGKVGRKTKARASRRTKAEASQDVAAPQAKAEASQDVAAPQAKAQPADEAKQPSRTKPARKTVAKAAKPEKTPKTPRARAPKAKATKAKPPKAKPPKAKVPEG